MEKNLETPKDCGCADGCCTPPKKKPIAGKIIFFLVVAAAAAILIFKFSGKSETGGVKSGDSLSVKNATPGDTSAKSCAQPCDPSKGNCCSKDKK